MQTFVCNLRGTLTLLGLGINGREVSCSMNQWSRGRLW
jgi:hypothetical protein